MPCRSQTANGSAGPWWRGGLSQRLIRSLFWPDLRSADGGLHDDCDALAVAWATRPHHDLCVAALGFSLARHLAGWWR